MNIHQWKQQIKNFNASFEHHPEVRSQWNVNTLANLHRFKKENSVWNLEWKYYREKEKAMVLVGSSDCLTKDVKYLKNLGKNFCIICANSSLKYLLRNGIKPDYVITLDSDDIDIPQHLDIDRDDVTLLASTALCGKALDNWKGPIYFMPYYSIDKELRLKVRRILGKTVRGGGNSITQALYVASIIFGSKTVIFVANEYCFEGRKKYYADKKAAKQEPLKVLTSCVDILGRQKWTLPSLFNYAVWTEKICADLSPPGFFIDTSFGLLGKDTDAIHVMKLPEAIAKVNEAFKIRDKLNRAETNEKRESILRRVTIKNEPSEVYRYNMQEHRERLLQLARG
jgi:hypothetical protein